MNFLVTGGCGFIGSHLAEGLLKEGRRVAVLDDLSSGYERNIAYFRKDVEFIRADVRDAAKVLDAARGRDGIFHEAALVSVFDSVNRPRDNHEINVTGTLNVLEAARAAGVKRVVFASSAAVYGDDPALPKRESMRPAPASPYAAAKITGEHYLSVYARLYGVESVALRYFNVFGPRQDPSSMYSGVISKFAQVLKAGETPVIYGDGRQSRDFVFVADVVQANLKAMQSPAAGNGEAFNIGIGRRVDLLALLKAMGKILGRPAAPRFEPARAGDVRDSLADVSLAREKLGYAPAFSLEEGLRALLLSTPEG
jgi:UDP-glucose 4-epimerase